MTGRYHRPPKWNWFMAQPAYIKFVIREMTAVFIGIYLVVLLVMLHRLGGGEVAFTELLSTLKRPLWTVIHFLALLAALWHSITWFNLTPKAMPIFLGEKRVADPLVAIAMGYGPWVLVSVVILWGVMR